jgi:hypothetical protein
MRPRWPGLAEGTTLVVDPPGAAKMSEALIALIKPEWDHCRDEEDMKKLLSLGAIAWNAALVPEAEQAAFLQEFAEKVPCEIRQDFVHLVEPLIQRKNELFPHNQRPIIDFELSFPAGKPYVTVISGLA